MIAWQIYSPQSTKAWRKMETGPFRDYAKPLQGDVRFIHVKSDEERILTCVLEYEESFVRVTDLLYEKTDGTWTQKVGVIKSCGLPFRWLKTISVKLDL
jgi:hypothetical protein